MGTDAPTIVTIPVRCAPKKAPCPKCGKLGRRKRTLPPRRVRTVAYKAIAYLEITCGEYQARCDCCTTFRNTPEGVLPRALYDNKVRDLVLERILEDGMNVERTLQSIRREFLLDLSTGFVYDVLRDRAAQLDMAEHRRMVLEHFSGTLCVDELHLGRFTLLLATDPLRDLPVAFALVGANDQDHMRRFLRNLKNWGLEPRRRDHRRLEPLPGRAGRAVARRRASAVRLPHPQGHQRVDPRRRAAAAHGDGPAGQGRAEEEARPQGGQVQAAAARRGLTVKEKAAFVFKHRHLIVKRRENFTEPERDDLGRMLEYLPELATLRQFADRIYWLFDTPKDYHQASCRRSAIVRDRGLPGRARVGQGAGATEDGEVPQDHGLPEQPGEPAGADQQSRGADQPDDPVPGEGAVQMAAAEDAGAVRGPALDDIWSHWAPVEVREAKSAEILRRPRTQAPARQRPRRVA